jgi:hypothetical protein
MNKRSQIFVRTQVQFFAQTVAYIVNSLFTAIGEGCNIFCILVLRDQSADLEFGRSQPGIYGQQFFIEFAVYLREIFLELIPGFGIPAFFYRSDQILE